MDRILFVPAYVPPHKRGQQISSPYHRLAMLALATAEMPQIFISTIELEAPSRPYTIETLRRLQTEYRDASLFFIMGADSFKDVTTWREYEGILTGYNCIVATRPGYLEGERISDHLTRDLQARIIDLRGGLSPSDLSLATPHIYLTDFVAVDVSATGVRAAVAGELTIADQVPPAVSGYIAKYQLYR